MSDLYRDQRVSKRLRRGLRQARREAGRLPELPQAAPDIMQQLRRMLPAEGWLTRRMADLRAKAHRVREGHVARIEQLRQVFSKLPAEAKKAASQELIARYKELRLDQRLERLDKTATANELKIRQLTNTARQAVAQRDQQKAYDLIKAAEKLQKHNTRLLKFITAMERKLADLAEQIARRAER